MPALRFTRLNDPGALKTHDGRQTLLGPDRHQPRQREQLAPSLETAQQRVDQQSAARKGHQDKVAAAAATGHGPRLDPRTRALVVRAKERKDAQHHQAKRIEHACAIGAPPERADRDCRTQTIMTRRTLRLANALMACMGALGEHLPKKVRLDGSLRLLFARSGSRMATVSQVVSWGNTAGVSLPSRRLLAEVVEGLCAMEVRDQGKPLRVYLKDMPP
jgi:hypothetical protein